MTNITLYHANWCSHCIAFKPEWEKLTKEIDKLAASRNTSSSSRSITYEVYEDTANPDVMKKNNITGYPTIRINRKDYDGERDAKSIMKKLNKLAVGGRRRSSRVKKDYKYKYLKYKSKYINIKNI